MKTWIGIGVVMGLALVMGLGGAMFRHLAEESSQLSVNGPVAERGLELVIGQGCVACHTLDGRPGIGPTWQGMFGRTETMSDGSTVVVDEAYIRESIERPGARVVAGYNNIMLPYQFSDEDMAAIIEFARQMAQE